MYVKIPQRSIRLKIYRRSLFVNHNFRYRITQVLKCQLTIKNSASNIHYSYIIYITCYAKIAFQLNKLRQNYTVFLHVTVSQKVRKRSHVIITPDNVFSYPAGNIIQPSKTDIYKDSVHILFRNDMHLYIYYIHQINVHKILSPQT